MRAPARWQALVSVATLGTARAPLPADIRHVADDLDVPEGDPPVVLLRAAAALGLQQLAGGRIPAVDGRVVVPPAPPAHVAAPADVAVVSDTAAWRLVRMLNGERRELVPEWFAVARAAAAVLPPHWLPPVLGALRPAERAQYAATLGPLASWLATANPEWSGVPVTADAPTDDVWTTGTQAQRDEALRSLRATDPARARRWIESTWTEDPPDVREACITALRIGLSADDEALLERALDDKRKSVRLAAAATLALLPDSAHAHRTRARLSPLITMTPAEDGLPVRSRPRSLRIDLPAAVDKAAQRDGIELKPPAPQKVGERVFWLTQMVSMLPPTHWSTSFSCAPADFLAAVAETDYAFEMLTALSAAAVAHPTDAWVRALTDRWLALGAGVDPAARVATLAALLDAAPGRLQSELAREIARQLGPADFEQARAVLAGTRREWDAETTALALQLLAEAPRRDVPGWPRPRNVLDDWAVRAHLETAQPRMAALLDGVAAESPWRLAVEQFVAIISFRHALRKELLP